MKAWMCPRRGEGGDVSGDKDWGKMETRKETKIFCAAKL